MILLVLSIDKKIIYGLIYDDFIKQVITVVLSFCNSCSVVCKFWNQTKNL